MVDDCCYMKSENEANTGENRYVKKLHPNDTIWFLNLAMHETSFTH